MKTTDYHCGVIDAFNEMVACGVKRLALSHPFATAEERAQVLPFVETITAKYHTMYYLEDRLLISDLFDPTVHEGKYMILFYREEKDLQAYLELKMVRAESLRRREYATVRTAIAHRFGELLSYPNEQIDRLIAQKNDAGTIAGGMDPGRSRNDDRCLSEETGSGDGLLCGSLRW